MCGVIGLIYEHDKPDMGAVASRLLKMLEYRGYDSTGAVVQTADGEITLKKDVGAPTDLTVRLGIDKMVGGIFCGQVRWATFGVVTRENAQPHRMSCKIEFYGAHNGNITNCQRLKEWLIAEGHDVKSDNDGEMLVHTVEHFFALELLYKDVSDNAVREKALIAAVLKASKKLIGSYAAVVVDPISRVVVAIKAGSSLYIGSGEDPVGGNFVIASSDLASVLQLSRILLPIRENEFAVFKATRIDLYDLRTGKRIQRDTQRSLLKVEETRLQHPHKYFMEQEIAGQVHSTRRVLSLFYGGNPVTQLLRRSKKFAPTVRALKAEVLQLASITETRRLAEACRGFIVSKPAMALRQLLAKNADENFDTRLESSHASFLEEVRDLISTPEFDVAGFVKYLDAIFDLEDSDDIERRLAQFVKIITAAQKRGNAIYMLACGSSFHAAKTAPAFFDEIAHLPIIPLLPGEFRAQCTHSLRDGDVIIGISQSGETKDLIDVFNFVARTYPKIKRVCILNNTNSTLALEKSDLFVPLCCGPEIAVPATKSFINQLLVLLVLAMRVAAAQPAPRGKGGAKAAADKAEANLHMLRQIPDLIDRTLKTTAKETDEMAAALFLKPSVHILATRILGIAKEGALKIREIVLNHTEGFEGSEFKHGPNTILGINTVFGMDAIQGILDKFGQALVSALGRPDGRAVDARGTVRLFKSLVDFAFRDANPDTLSDGERRLFDDIFKNHNFFDSLYSNYPLIFITCPNEQDINLTISQINTHKIRGANVYMIAEDNDQLREAVSLPPSTAFPYHHGYATLPRTGNTILSIFSVTVVLQVLALKMSKLKMQFLDRLEVASHGVHPDVPKNVSKSITVD